jgi:hypothetical protein
MNATQTKAAQSEYSDVAAPVQMDRAAAALRELTSDDAPLVDCLANDTADNFRALMTSIAECRETIAEIEATARERVAKEAAYHRENLESIEALGILEAA